MAVHHLLENRTTATQTSLLIVVDSAVRHIAARKSHEHKAPVSDDVVSNALCSKTTDTANGSSNDIMMFIQSVFITLGLSQEGVRLSRVVL